MSFVIPVKNEAQTLRELTAKVTAAASPLARQVQIILVDDGSSDDSWPVMQALVGDCPGLVEAIRLRRNFGKATALATGFLYCSGEIVFTLDADLQDDPNEMSRFIEKLEQGYDVVSCWKERRQDPASKTLPSRLFNKVTGWLSGIELHDFNCGFKAYRREVLDNIRLYGELHRYIPVLAHDLGYRIGEVAVRHHERRHGVSKYGWERYARGLLDLITVVATTRYLQKPGHLFGGGGLIAGVGGSAILAYLAVLWFLDLGPIGTRPLFFVGLLLIILSIQLISLGVVAELLTRHNESRSPELIVAERIGGQRPSPANPGT